MHAQGNGIRIRYEIEGEGPWLVMSHSLACNLAMWDAQVSALRGRFKVLRFDTRGHGGTDAPAGAYTLDQLADDLQALLDSLGVAKCSYMGLSMGGMIGMTHALKYPGRFDRLVLCNTTSRVGPEAAPIWKGRIDAVTAKGMEAVVDGTLTRWFTAPFLARKPEVASRVGTMIRETPVAGYVGCCHAIPKIDLNDRLGAVQCPTLVIAGDQDVGTPVEMARAIQLAIPGAQLAVIPSASHLSNLEQPEVFDYFSGRFLTT
ncbi:MAG: 3-oxoadipate enol-lactonase [Burkholderiales bacterium]|nr:3-oxoadipate enol-lactonase [Burkholderiales bacterium]